MVSFGYFLYIGMLIYIHFLTYCMESISICFHTWHRIHRKMVYLPTWMLGFYGFYVFMTIFIWRAGKFNSEFAPEKNDGWKTFASPVGIRHSFRGELLNFRGVLLSCLSHFGPWNKSLSFIFRYWSRLVDNGGYEYLGLHQCISHNAMVVDHVYNELMAVQSGNITGWATGRIPLVLADFHCHQQSVSPNGERLGG